MRRLLVLVLLAGVLAGAALLTGGRDGGAPENVRYTIEVDNAFGLIEGGDFKVAGVRAGKIAGLRLDRRTKRALVDVTLTERGFGSLRRDVTCNVAPQSLVGEYYLSCTPGSDPERLRSGSVIAVDRTTTTVPPDLVANIMRRPYRERLSLVLNELGAAVAGNADNLNAAVRRASPALRETSRVLAVLGRQNQVLADLAKNADTVLTDLAAKRTDVSRFVVEARDTARASAERDRDLAEGFRRLPEFLRELEPTMAELGRTADAHGPALRSLASSADQLETLLQDVQPFADASRPALRALGDASDVGRTAVRRARPTVDALDRYATGAPELGRNLAIVLEHLDSREHAVEEDPRSPGGKGYTGLEALLQYVFDQTLAINVHDGETHILKVYPFEGECAAYADIRRAKEVGRHCSAGLGPNQIGINFPDATAPAGYDGSDRGPEGSDTNNRRARDGGGAAPPDALAMPPMSDVLPGAPAAPSPPPSGAAERPPAPIVSDLPQIPGVPVPDDVKKDEQDSQNDLLDFLLGS